MIFWVWKLQCSNKWCQSATCKWLREGWLYVAWQMSSEGCIAVTDVILELLRVANERAALLPLSSVGMMSEGSSEGCIQLRVVLLWPMWVLPCYLGHPRAAADMTFNIRGLPVLSQNCFIKKIGRGQDCVNNKINIIIEDMDWISHKTFSDVYWC